MGYVSTCSEAHESREPPKPTDSDGLLRKQSGSLSASHYEELITQQVAALKQEHKMQMHDERNSQDVESFQPQDVGEPSLITKKKELRRTWLSICQI